MHSAWGRGQRIKPLLQALAMGGGVFWARLRTENWIESLGEAIVSVSLTWSMPTTLQMFASRVVILVQCSLVGSDEVLRDKDEAGTPKGRELFASSRRNAVVRTEVTPCWRYVVGQIMCYAPSWSHAGRRVMKQSSMINPFAPKHPPLLHTSTNKKEPCDHNSPPKCRLGRMITTPEITGDKVMHQIAAEVGTWNIFILNAGHLPNPTSIASANLFDCWTILTYEVRSHSLFPQYFPIKPSHNTNNNILTQTNAKAVIISATAFLPTANKISYTIHLLYTPHFSTPSSVSVVTPTT